MRPLPLIAAVLLAVLAPRPAAAFVPTRTAAGHLVSWPGRNVVMVPDAEEVPGLDAADFQATAQAAAANWRRADICSDMLLEVAPARAGLTVGYDPDGPAVNLIRWVLHDWPHEPSAVALTTVTFGQTTGTTFDADVELNAAQHRFTIDPGSSGSIGSGEDGARDLQSVLTHELGHVLGLEHPCDDGSQGTEPVLDIYGEVVPSCCGEPGNCSTSTARANLKDRPDITTATMFSFSEPGETGERSPESDDVLGVCTLYPRITFTVDQPGHGCQVLGSSPGRSPEGGPRLLILALMLGLAGLAARRWPGPERRGDGSARGGRGPDERDLLAGRRRRAPVSPPVSTLALDDTERGDVVPGRRARGRVALLGVDDGIVGSVPRERLRRGGLGHSVRGRGAREIAAVGGQQQRISVGGRNRDPASQACGRTRVVDGRRAADRELELHVEAAAGVGACVVRRRVIRWRACVRWRAGVRRSNGDFFATASSHPKKAEQRRGDQDTREVLLHDILQGGRGMNCAASDWRRESSFTGPCSALRTTLMSTALQALRHTLTARSDFIARRRRGREQRRVDHQGPVSLDVCHVWHRTARQQPNGLFSANAHPATAAGAGHRRPVQLSWQRCPAAPQRSSAQASQELMPSEHPRAPQPSPS
jgi:hypothetical protein